MIFAKMKRPLLWALILIAVAFGVALSRYPVRDESPAGRSQNLAADHLVIYGALSSGKSSFLQDEEVSSIFSEQYQLILDMDEWSNTKMLADTLVDADGYLYDCAFFSDTRYLDVYKQESTAEGPDRFEVLHEISPLNTPVVFYSWATVVESLIEEGIVMEENGIYFLTDMNKFLALIMNDTSWEEMGQANVFGNVSITTCDPQKTSAGASFYALLSIHFNGGTPDEADIEEISHLLRDISEKIIHYESSAELMQAFMDNGSYTMPVIADFERALIDYAAQNPDIYKEFKDDIRIIYPLPTIYVSHTLACFTENGVRFAEALQDPGIQKIAFNRYGYRYSMEEPPIGFGEGNISGLMPVVNETIRKPDKNTYDTILHILS